MNEDQKNRMKQKFADAGQKSYLFSLIFTYKVRLAKIEKAANSITEWNQEKAYKTSAAKQTKRFISDLRKLEKVIK